jgi:Raf kinase inhibitor-like YbhB/YbcL family protein
MTQAGACIYIARGSPRAAPLTNSSHGNSIAEEWNVRFQIVAVLITATTFAAAQKLSSAGGSPEHRTDLEITWHILKPAELPAPDVSQLHVPAGFRVQKFAENVGNARILAVGPRGNVYVTRREEGDVLMYRAGADGLAAGRPDRVASRSGLHGITFSKGEVYLASVHEIFRADVHPDGTFGPLETIIHDLPDAGQHNTRTVQIGPDDMMYISIGSTCNECAEPNPENATILRAALDGKSRSIFASGLRDTVGWGWQPETGELWGVDNGMDGLGDNVQPEELNPHLDPPGGLQKSELSKTNVPMAMGYTAHAAPMQLSFYNATPLTVSSTAFAQGGTIPAAYSSYDQNASPPLRWTQGPRGTQSYAILSEDPDAKTTPLPVVHWVVWNIPGTVTALREGFESLDRLEDPMGLRQGPNTAAGNVGYKGPHPPEGDPPHHYHFEVFTLDRVPDLRAGANREDLVKAMAGHVLAKGELVGLFKRPEYPVRP